MVSLYHPKTGRDAEKTENSPKKLLRVMSSGHVESLFIGKQKVGRSSEALYRFLHEEMRASIPAILNAEWLSGQMALVLPFSRRQLPRGSFCPHGLIRRWPGRFSPLGPSPPHTESLNPVP